MMRVLSAMVWGCLILMLGAGFVQAAPEKKAVPVVEVENPTYEFNRVTQGEVVKHDFPVFNRGTAPLEIKNVKPD